MLERKKDKHESSYNVNFGSLCLDSPHPVIVFDIEQVALYHIDRLQNFIEVALFSCGLCFKQNILYWLSLKIPNHFQQICIHSRTHKFLIMTAAEDPILLRGGLREFVRNEPNWDVRLGDRWVYQGRIHSSDRAIVTHFRYEDREFEDNDPPHTKDVVAKIQLRQPDSGSRPNGYPEGYTGFAHEGQFLQLISGYYGWKPYTNRDCIPDRPHNIVRHYRDQMVPPADDNVPLGNRNVVSLLEYCPGIVITQSAEQETRFYDLKVFDYFSDAHVQEIDIWHIFKQFTRMILMLDCGSEIPRDVRQRRSFWESERMEMCHYDIHPGNSKFPWRTW